MIFTLEPFSTNLQLQTRRSKNLMASIWILFSKHPDMMAMPRVSSLLLIIVLFSCSQPVLAQSKGELIIPLIGWDDTNVPVRNLSDTYEFYVRVAWVQAFSGTNSSILIRSPVLTWWILQRFKWSWTKPTPTQISSPNMN